MRAAAAFVAVCAGLSVPAGLAAPPPHKNVKPLPPTLLPALGTATAAAEPATAGARPAVLTVSLRLELQCGRPRVGVVVVTLPAAMRAPAEIEAADVLVGGRTPLALHRHGRVFTLMLRPTVGMTCDVLAPGNLTVVFARGAALGNPVRSGSYPVVIRAGSTRAVAHLVVG